MPDDHFNLFIAPFPPPFPTAFGTLKLPFGLHFKRSACLSAALGALHVPFAILQSRSRG
jgi:hypothetical protein